MKNKKSFHFNNQYLLFVYSRKKKVKGGGNGKPTKNKEESTGKEEQDLVKGKGNTANEKQVKI